MKTHKLYTLTIMNDHNPPSCFDIIIGDKTNNPLKFLSEFERDVYHHGEEEARRVFAWLLRNNKYDLLCELASRISSGDVIHSSYGPLAVKFPVQELCTFVTHLYASTDLWGLFTGSKTNYAFRSRIISYGKSIIALSKKSLELNVGLDLHTDIGRYVLFDPLTAAKLIIGNFHNDRRKELSDEGEDQYDEAAKNLEVYTTSVFIMLDNLQIEESTISVSDSIASVYSILKELSTLDKIYLKDRQSFIVILERMSRNKKIQVGLDGQDYLWQTINILIDGIDRDYLRRALSEIVAEGAHVRVLNIILARMKSQNIDISNNYISALISKPFSMTPLYKYYNQTPEFYEWLIGLFDINSKGSFIVAWKLLNKVNNYGLFAQKVIDRFRDVIEEDYNISYLVDTIEIPTENKPAVIKKLLMSLSNDMIASYVEDIAMDLPLLPTIHRNLAAEMVDNIRYMDDDEIKIDIINKYMPMFLNYAMVETKEAILGLESLELPALVTYLILTELSSFANILPMYVMWNKITGVKHRPSTRPIKRTGSSLLKTQKKIRVRSPPPTPPHQ